MKIWSEFFVQRGKRGEWDSIIGPFPSEKSALKSMKEFITLANISSYSDINDDEFRYRVIQRDFTMDERIVAEHEY